MRNCETQIFTNDKNFYALDNASSIFLSNGELPNVTGSRKEVQSNQQDAATSRFWKKITFSPFSIFNLPITTRHREAGFPFLPEKCVNLLFYFAIVII